MNQAITLSTCAFGSGEHNSSYYARQFERAMKAGFDGFELTLYSDNDVPQVLEAVHLSGAPIVAVHGVGKGNWFADTPEEQKKAAVESARYLEHFAEFAPCPAVQHYLDRFNDPEMGKKFHDVMAYLLEETEKLNFLFCMENAPYKPEHNERFPNVAEVAAFSRSFGKDRMFMTFDLNHANLNEDPVAVCADCAGLVRHIHISDNHGFREEHLVPGAGIMDLGGIMTALYQHGYSGPWNLEFVFPEKTEPTLEQYQQVYLYMKNLVAQIPAHCSC